MGNYKTTKNKQQMSFVVPEIEDNPLGWGPASIPENFSDVPYAPFGKGDKVGKISDWNQSYQRNNYNRDGKNTQLLKNTIGKAFLHKNQSNEEFKTINREPKVKTKKTFQSAWNK